MNRKHIAEVFVRDGKVAIPFVTSDLARYVVDGARTVFSLPAEKKPPWTLDFSGVEKPDDGYVRKNGPDGEYVYDKKDFFHYRYFTQWELKRHGVDIGPHRHWLEACDMLYRRCVAESLAFAKALDRVLPGYNFWDLIIQGKEKHVLRILSYDPVTPAERVLAVEHPDKDGFTIHIAEERPGARFTETDEMIVVKPDQALIFPGMKLEAITGGRLKALKHEVIETDFNAAERRWSIVFFAHTDTTDLAGYREK